MRGKYGLKQSKVNKIGKIVNKVVDKFFLIKKGLIFVGRGGLDDWNIYPG